MTGRIALIGATGQLGTELCQTLEQADLIPLTHQDIEVTNPCSVFGALAAIQPGVVINTAAFHQVDRCEENPWHALEVNTLGAHHVAQVARSLGARVVFLSTDYVFSGDACHPYQETDSPCPINVYGASKLAGERLVLASAPDNLVIRTSGLYGHAGPSGKGSNFVELMRRLGREQGEVTVVTDQVLSPTFATDLARAIAALIAAGGQGVVHLTNAGACSWWQFATTIFELLDMDVQVNPTSSNAYGARAARPQYSALANNALADYGLRPLRPWREALAAYLADNGS